MSLDLSLPIDRLPDPLPIPPIERPPVDPVVVRPPGSKSITNRALLLAGLASGESVLRGALSSADDAVRMIEAINTLGAVASAESDLVRVTGASGRWRVPTGGAVLDLGNAGTATRFLAAAASLADGPVVIDGNSRMRERPIGELTDALPALGVEVEFLGSHGFPPVRLHPPTSGRATEVSVEFGTTKSSQFLSALLLLGPWFAEGVTLRLTGEITSRPYIALTLWLLDKLGARVRCSEDLRVLRVGPPDPATPAGLQGFELDVEPDASGATYFWAAGAILPGASVGVRGLGDDSPQGDAAFLRCLAKAGAVVERSASDQASTVRGPAALDPVDIDMSDMPDAAMTLAAVCVFARGRSVLRGLRTLRDKETDRIAALQNELRKIGVRVETDVPGDPHALSITPPAGGVPNDIGCAPVEFDTYDDHRMAMSLALIGLRRPNCLIRDPGCVRKTYPSFWSDLGAIYA